ncbi:MAG: hypothetical protein KGS72_23500 [Cyanobacteria bacterium REEB67]|nr:hypothetical protein [Cyanobacteria bacterium REEB67]
MKSYLSSRQTLSLSLSLSLSFSMALALTVMPALTEITDQAAEARGGGGRGGGGGGFRGGGERGFGDRDGLDDGYRGGRGDWGDGYRSEGYRGDEGRANIDDTPHVSEEALRSGADQTYGSARSNGLSTDGGFGRLNANNYTSAAQAGRDFSQTHPQAQAALVDHGADVRNNWAGRYGNDFGRDWWNRHNDWWGYDGWGYGWWGGVGWGGLAPYWGMSEAAAPVDYDYGNNITYQGDQVYYGSTPTASTVQYYQQAQTLANSAPAVPTIVVNGKTQVSGDWKPLGVFALSQSGDTSSNTIFQLAVNKAGVISGNYYNTLNNQSTPVHGKVDKKSMRAAFTVGKNKDVVYDTGLANLLEPQSTILVHLSKDKTQQEVLVRLDPPKNGDSGGAKSSS